MVELIFMLNTVVVFYSFLLILSWYSYKCMPLLRKSTAYTYSSTPFYVHEDALDEWKESNSIVLVLWKWQKFNSFSGLGEVNWFCMSYNMVWRTWEAGKLHIWHASLCTWSAQYSFFGVLECFSPHSHGKIIALWKLMYSHTSQKDD